MIIDSYKFFRRTNVTKAAANIERKNMVPKLLTVFISIKLFYTRAGCVDTGYAKKIGTSNITHVP